MPTKIITYKDAKITVHASLLGNVSIDVSCRYFIQTGLSTVEFAALVYPAISAKSLDPTPPRVGTTTVAPKVKRSRR